MAKCQVCNKGVVFGANVSHAHNRTNRNWKPNVKKVKIAINGTTKSVYMCTSCLRTSKKLAAN